MIGSVRVQRLERNITCGIRKRNGSWSHVHALGINNGLQGTSMGDSYQKNSMQPLKMARSIYSNFQTYSTKVWH